jgi:pilus assembly protein CpaB
MNKRLLTILLLAFVIAGACAFLVYRVIGNRLGAAAPSTTRVVAASADIKLGHGLTAANLTTVEVGSVPKGAILDPKNAIGRGVVSDIYQGEPILESRLAPVGSGGGLAATIPDGMRAIAVKVDDVVGVAGFVTPGMHVDVLVSGTPPGANNAPNSHAGAARHAGQDHPAEHHGLSAGVNIQKDAEGKPQQVQVVNLLVTPEQAETLSLITNGVKDPACTSQSRLIPRPIRSQGPPWATSSRIRISRSGAKTGCQGGSQEACAGTSHPSPSKSINGSKRTEEKFGTPEAKQ